MQLRIEKLAYGGDGLARLPADEHGPGKAAFVPFVLDGELIEADLLEEKPGFVRARANQILEASSNRVEPPCPYFARCGGCHYQHASYQHQIEIKSAILKETLRRIGKIELSDVAVHASPEWNYRNRTRLKVQTQPQFAIGYYRLNSHELLAVEKCPISSPLINIAIAELWRAGRDGSLPAEIEEIELFANAEDDQLLVEIYCVPGITPEAGQKIAASIPPAVPQAVGIAVFSRDARKGGLASKIANLGGDEIDYHTSQHTFRVSAGAFFQINRFLVDQLIELATGGLSGDLALDLYAGVGLFASALGQSFAQVMAVEASPISYQDLLYNSGPNTRAVHATTDQFLKNMGRKLRPDLVLVDPPRSGLGEVVVRSLVSLGAHQITYVSCDPATLARDLKGLLNAGYHLRRAEMVDLFPQTFHLESVFHLTK